MAADVPVSRTEFDAFCYKQYPLSQASKTMRRDRCERIVRYLQGLQQPPDGSWRYRIEKKGYTLVNFPSLGLEEVLCVKGTEIDGTIEQGKYKQWRRVVPVEEFYDILLETHLNVQKHGGYKNLLKMVQLNYAGIPREAAVKFVSLCSVCQRNGQQQTRTAKATEANKSRVIKVACTTDVFNMRCQIDLINMMQNPDGDYAHIGLYMDHWTKFVTLFPMVGCSAEHVAYGLVSSVFPYYGPPRFLHCLEGKEFALEVIRLSMEKWTGGEKTTVPQGKPGLLNLGKVIENTRDTLIEKINNRAEVENIQGHIPWASWLGKIMFDMNNKVNEETGKSAYGRVFERTIGLPDSGEPTEPLKDFAVNDRRGVDATMMEGLDAERTGHQGKQCTSSDDDGIQTHGSYSEEAPIIIQAEETPAQIVLAEEVDTVLPVAATEIYIDNQMLEERQTFTTTYMDPSGEVQNFIISVEPAER